MPVTSSLATDSGNGSRPRGQQAFRALAWPPIVSRLRAPPGALPCAHTSGCSLPSWLSLRHPTLLRTQAPRSLPKRGIRISRREARKNVTNTHAG